LIGHSANFLFADHPEAIVSPQLSSAKEAGGQQHRGIASIDSQDGMRARELVTTPGLQSLNSNGRVVDVTNHHQVIGG
jgi:hypothetical protein